MTQSDFDGNLLFPQTLLYSSKHTVSENAGIGDFHRFFDNFTACEVDSRWIKFSKFKATSDEDQDSVEIRVSVNIKEKFVSEHELKSKIFTQFQKELSACDYDYFVFRDPEDQAKPNSADSDEARPEGGVRNLRRPRSEL